MHIERVRQIDGHTVLLEDIWLPQADFKALLKPPLDHFGDLLYPLYECATGSWGTASEVLSVETADRLTAKHLGIDLGRPVVRIERTALDYSGRALEWRASRGAADGFQYQVDIH